MSEYDRKVEQRRAVRLVRICVLHKFISSVRGVTVAGLSLQWKQSHGGGREPDIWWVGSGVGYVSSKETRKPAQPHTQGLL